MIKFVKNDGGRAASGYVGKTGDCVARSIAIVMDLPYQVATSSGPTLDQRNDAKD